MITPPIIRPASSDTSALLQEIVASATKLAHDKQQQAFRYRFSSAGDHCRRKLVYDAQDAADGLPQTGEVPPLKRVIQAAVGTAVGELLEAGAQRLGLQTQQRVTADGARVEISGSLDIHSPDDLVVDIKTVSDPAWSRLRYGPQEKHVVQVNGYAVYTKAPRWALWYVRLSDAFRRTDNNEIGQRVFEGQADPDFAQRTIVEAWEDVDAHVAMGTVPARDPAFLRDRFPCGWSTGACVHFSRCWAEPQRQLVQLKTEVVKQSNTDAADAA
jgi:hypothetical protein